MYTNDFLPCVQPRPTFAAACFANRLPIWLWVLSLGLVLIAPLTPTASAAESVRISEFMANNFRTLADEDLDYEDWIELANVSGQPVSLEGWYLTDEKLNLKKWRFPAVTLPPNGYLVVFASGKDRTPPVGPLHTNFKLSSNTSGDKGYLGLVASNGVTIVSEFAPSYPPQVANVSYGFPVQDNRVTLIAAPAAAKVYVPTDDRYGRDWATREFSDATWSPATNGVGYEADQNVLLTPTLLADSVRDFSGNQGQGNWYYGYWDRQADGDGVYSPEEFKQFPRSQATVLAADNFFANNSWRWFPTTQASTELNRQGGIAAGSKGVAGKASHWLVRRWISETNGTARIYLNLANEPKCTPAASGDGVVGRVFVNGVEVFSQTAVESGAGFQVKVQLTLGEAVDFVIDPGTAQDDTCDNAALNALIYTESPTVELLADSAADFTSSGEQGAKGWSYGYYDRSSDQVANYQTNDFKPFSDAFWNGVEWLWPDGNPPYDRLAERSMRPTAALSGGEHWPIRRWVSRVSGNLTLHLRAGKRAAGGTGVSARVFHKGGTAKLTTLLTSTNVLGTNAVIVLPGVVAGDPIDIALDPVGVSGNADDVADETEVDVRIFGNASLGSYVTTDVKSRMQNLNSSAYVRLPFNVTNASIIETLSLQLRYDAGFVAYLNGIEVLRRNSPSEPTWNSAATLERTDAEAGFYETFDLAADRDLLQVGANVLALQLMNSTPSDTDALIQALLTAGFVTSDFASPRYFPIPTPGTPNGLGTTNLGPIIVDTRHTPKIPREGEPLTVTALVTPSFNSIGPVQLFYRVLYAAETNAPMFDDGQHGDGAANDGVYGATIPATAYKAGNMVRYYVRATDRGTNVTRDPVFVKGKPMPEYWGTIVQNPGLTNPLPVFYWFSQTTSAGDAGGTSSIFYHDQFLDNVRFTIHGQSSSGFPKHSFNVDLNPGYKLVWKDGEPAIDDINLLTTYPDKAKMRNMLAHNTFRDAGTPYHFVVPVRIQFNGQFWGDWHFVENGDDNYLKRAGLDPNGALYKMYSTFPSDVGTIEKKTRKNESNGDITAFRAGLNRSGAALAAFLMDNVNVPEVVNYLAAMTITGNTDCCHKNYYFYRDSEGTGEWHMLPWDVDLSFGRVWSGSPTYWDDTMYVDTPLRIGNNNDFVIAFLGNASINQMYLRRLRTLMEELMQAPGTPANLLKYERFIDEWIPKLAPDAALDLAKWGTFSGDAGGGSANDNRNRQSLTQAANIIKYEYLPGRRKWLFTSTSTAEIPKSQPQAPAILIGAMESNPNSGNQDEEYFTLVNTNKVSIDISHWQIRGAIDLTFQGGTVIPTNGTLYVSPNVNAFRARATGPRGGQGLFVQGNYRGHLSARGETIQLVDARGGLIAQTNSPAAPSATQNGLRITEIMYHPAPAPQGVALEPDDFEYLELKNTGATSLNLTGVRLVNGVQFDFSTAAIKDLAAGQSVLLVRNATAFASRYGAGKPIAGQYIGTLSDSGENLRLVDAANEVILDFDYNNSWYPVTDGLGMSLVIVNPAAAWDTWGLRTSWRASTGPQGSPGGDDPAAPPPFVAVTINEVLSHSRTVADDAIELFNPSALQANIGNWYLTDDFNTPKKYRIPANTVLSPGGFLVIREAQFNPGGAGSFSLSANGDELYLFSANANGDLTGYVTGYQFGAALDGVTFGPQVTSTGDIHFVARATPTLGGTNSPPQVGPLVFSEIMFHPAPDTSDRSGSDFEYVELSNLSDAAVSFLNPANPTNQWRISGGIGYTFATNLTVSARGKVVLVNFNPTTNPEAKQAFLDRYRLGAGAAYEPVLLGPYTGNLGNAGDGIALYQPDAADDKGVTGFVLADWVRYEDQAPWPTLADGYGAALLRSPRNAYGNDPASWIAARPSPGFADADGLPPAIAVQPASITPAYGTTVSLSATANGAATLAYQWLQDGTAIPGATQASLDLPAINLTDGGVYQVVVMNGNGATLSSNATLTVRQPIFLFQSAQDRNNLPGSTANFSVLAVGEGLLSYQWLRNGTNIPGATNSSFSVQANVQNQGDLQLRITDNYGSLTTTPVRFVLYDVPTVNSAPQSIAVLPGEEVIFHVGVNGKGPLAYRWQRGSTARTNFVSSLNFSYHTVPNASLSVTGAYSVIITNPAGGKVTSATANLTLLTDADNDRMADVWETLYNLKPNDPSDAALDSDGDGVSNLKEYQANTNPRDPNSYLRIDDLDSDAAGVLLRFFAQSNRTYTVELREGVDRGAWQTLTNVMVNKASRIETIRDGNPGAKGRIYRLVSPAVVSRPFPAPVILESPASAEVGAGGSVSLTVAAAGTGTLSYQWKHNGTLIPGAVGPTLTVNQAGPLDGGPYTVAVKDDFGTTETVPAVLTVRIR